MKILVVEDDPLIRRSLRELVEAWGYACDDAGDGLVALDLLQACPYDLVLLDLNLPKRDGLARQSGRDLSRGWPAPVRSGPGHAGARPFWAMQARGGLAGWRQGHVPVHCPKPIRRMSSRLPPGVPTRHRC